MQRRSLSILAFGAALLTASGVAHAEGGYVASGGSGILYSDRDLGERMRFAGNGVGAYGSVGYRWDQAFATEIEGGLRGRAYDGAAQAQNGRGGREDTTVLMFNARIAPDTRSPLKPYAGVGAGLALMNSQDHSLRSGEDDVAPAGQAMAGFSLDVSERTSFFAEYRYFKLMENAGASAAGARDESHAGFIGLRVRLGDFKK